MKLKKKSRPEVDSKISNFASEASNVEQEQGFMNPVKPRGRPKGAKNLPKDAPLPHNMGSDAETLASLKQLVTPVADMLSEVGYRVAEDEKARLSATEIDIITTSAAKCINLYLPNVMGKHADLIVLSVTMAQWSARVYMLRQMNLEKLRSQYRNSVKENSSNPDEVSAGLGGEIMQ